MLRRSWSRRIQGRGPAAQNAMLCIAVNDRTKFRLGANNGGYGRGLGTTSGSQSVISIGP